MAKLLQAPGCRSNAARSCDAAPQQDRLNGESFCYESFVSNVHHCPLPHAPDITQAFLTHNGKLIGVIFRRLPCAPDSPDLYPCVSLHGQGEQVRLNFGQRPFLFDLASSVAEEDEQTRSAMASVEISTSLVRRLVRDYLLHQARLCTGWQRWRVLRDCEVLGTRREEGVRGEGIYLTRKIAVSRNWDRAHVLVVTIC